MHSVVPADRRAGIHSGPQAGGRGWNQPKLANCLIGQSKYDKATNDALNAALKRPSNSTVLLLGQRGLLLGGTPYRSLLHREDQDGAAFIDRRSLLAFDIVPRSSRT